MSRSSAERCLLIERDAICVRHGTAERRIGFDWSPETALATLAAEPDSGVRRGARWEVVFADALVRYLVIRWPDGLRGRAEREAFVAHRFREVHAVGAPEWKIVVERAATGIPSLACAVPTLHAEAVAAWARANRLRLGAVTGEFIDAFNRVRPQLAHPFGALAVRRGGRLTVGLWRNALWQTLRSQPLGPDGNGSIGLFLESPDWRADGGEDGVLYCLGAAPATPRGWRVVSLEGGAWA